MSDAEDLRWSGADLVVPSHEDVGRSFAYLFRHLRDAYDAAGEADLATYLPRSIVRTVERLALQYQNLGPLFANTCEMPPAERVKRTAQFFDLINRVTVLELKLIAELARARSEWLSTYCHSQE